MPLLLAVFVAANRQDLAMYEDGTFARSVAGAEFMRLIKEPGSFALQLCSVNGLRAVVIDQIASVAAIAVMAIFFMEFLLFSV